METTLAVLAGFGLAAAVGFRVFVPFLVMSIAAHGGHLPLADDFAWIGSTPALITFSVATLFEVLAYSIPWVDHALDVVSGPAVVIAGSVAMASVVVDVSPFLRWTLAVIAGGGVAAAVQGGTALGRGASTLTTGGLANPLVSGAELGGSIVTSVLAVMVPVLAAAFVVAMLVWIGTHVRRWGARQRTRRRRFTSGA
jgi:hypothetical protein